MEVTTNINDIKLDITLDGNVAPIVIDNENGYPRNETILFTPTVSKDSSPFTNFTMTYAILDPDGDEVVSSVTGNNVSFPLDYLGTYTAVITIEDLDTPAIYTLTYNIESVDFFAIVQSDCNLFDVTNYSAATDVEYVVMDLFSADGETQTPLYEGTLGATGTAAFAFTDVSMYSIVITYTVDAVERTETYIINNYCVIEECIAQYTIDILCGDTRPCAECPDTIELNRMLALNYAYFLGANDEYGNNNFYSGMDWLSIKGKFSDMKLIMDKLLAYCTRRGCSGAFYGQTSENNTSSTNPCGCNG